MNILRRHAYDIGACFASLVWVLMPKRRRIATENILRCGVAQDPKEARRIVVYKMDLGMKPEKFEAMLAETAKKIQEA